jgi:hypothetical protein
MTRRIPGLLVLAAALGAMALPTAAQADFGLVPGSVRAEALNSNGTAANLAGSHPYSFTVHFDLKTDEVTGLTEGGGARDARVDLPPGFIGNPAAIPECTHQQFEGGVTHCPPSTQIGVLRANVTGLGEVVGPLYNLTPPPGYASEIAFSDLAFQSLQYISLNSDEGYGLHVDAPNLPLPPTSVTETIWGTPADPAHDAQRGADAIDGGKSVSSEAPLLPYLTLPASCEEAAPGLSVNVDSRLAPGLFTGALGSFVDSTGNPAPIRGCEAVPFAPKITAQPTSKLTTNPSGLDFSLNLPNQGLEGVNNTSETEPHKVRFTLPEGVTINPSAAEGIAGCSPAQFAAEQIDSAPGAGCPEASKLGSLSVQTPLLEETLEGSLYLASPNDNPFGTLAALYLVARAPERGIIVKQAGRIDLDPATGQIATTFEGLPPIPFSSFALHFREGGRAPLVTPPGCGEFRSVAQLYPFSAPDQATTAIASFQIERGTGGGACPSGGLPPFKPGLTAGTLNNAAGRYSPFNIRLTRNDSEQEITHFSIKLPPGITGKLAGIPFCSNAAIAVARSRTHEGGGGSELASPSCPKASEIGRILVGAGVGGVLTYVPGKVYLAGPYNGSALSIAAITAAKVGPFDLGTVVIREALKINPETAEVFIDATGSDPIPHIISGVPVHARDIRIYVDRPDFTLNPTSCKATSTASTVLGSGLDFASEADDRPITVTSPFQAADCASLNFKPQLALSLKGGTKRGDTPKFKAVLSFPKGANANVKTAQITLPHSEFLEQAHIKTVCTRVQFAAGAGNGAQCPAASIYGYATAITPLLDDPIKGPVFLRSSSHQLPDLVAALHNGEIDVNLTGRIDSVENGRIRNTFEAVPDAPVSKFTLEMQGGKKGLLVNSTDICKRTNRAIADFTGQNGKTHVFNPVLGASCKGKAKKKKRASAKGSSARLLARPFAW